MKEVKLNNNEEILFQEANVSIIYDNKELLINKLLVTNQNIIHIASSNKIRTIPISSISMFNKWSLKEATARFKTGQYLQIILKGDDQINYKLTDDQIIKFKEAIMYAQKCESEKYKTENNDCDKYEYLVLDDNMITGDLQDKLDELGENGWRLIQVVQKIVSENDCMNYRDPEYHDIESVNIVSDISTEITYIFERKIQ